MYHCLVPNALAVKSPTTVDLDIDSALNGPNYNTKAYGIPVIAPDAPRVGIILMA